MSNPIPNALALTSIGTGAEILSADHRNNYASLQAAVNQLSAALRGGNAGQVLLAADASDVQWGSVVALGQKISDLGVGSDGELGKLRVPPCTGLNGAVVLPAATVTVFDTTQFPAAGTLNVGGQTVTYTGKTATTFTGCTGGVGTISTNSNVYLAVGTPATAFDVIGVIYDPTVGKWVSPELMMSFDAGAASTSGAFFDSGVCGAVPWRAYNAAGLSPQLRYIPQVSYGFTGASQLGYQGGNYGAAKAATVVVTGATFNWTGSAAGFTYDSGWLDIPGGFTVADFLLPQPQFKANGANNGSNPGGTVGVRWVG